MAKEYFNMIEQCTVWIAMIQEKERLLRAQIGKRMGVGLILRRIDLLFRGSKRYFYPLGRKVCLLAPRFIAQWTKICAMTPANATTKVFAVRKIKSTPKRMDMVLFPDILVGATVTLARRMVWVMTWDLW